MHCVANAMESFKQVGVTALDKAFSAMGIHKMLEAVQQNIQFLPAANYSWKLDCGRAGKSETKFSTIYLSNRGFLKKYENFIKLPKQNCFFVTL